MKVLKVILIIFSLILFSCQNRNQVTHNKRKYRKGYYQPNRAKVKHRKNQQEERYVYNSNTEDKQNQTNRKQPKEKSNIPSSSTKKGEKEAVLNPTSDNKEHLDRATEENKDLIEKEHHPQQNGQIVRSSDKEGKTKADLPKQNWMYWLDLVLIFVVLLLIILTVVLYVSTASLLLAVLMGTGTLLLNLLGLITAAINLKKAKEGKEHSFTRFSNNAYVLIFVLLLLLSIGAFLLFML